MMTMLLILPLMMEFKEVEDSLLQCCYVWHGIVQVWLFSVKAIFTKKFHENDFTEFFFIFTGTWCKSALNGGSDGGTMRFKPECDHGGNAGKNLFVQKKEIEIVLLNLKYFQKISGLGIARDLLEPIKKKHPNVTYADLYILAGVVAVEEMGGNF